MSTCGLLFQKANTMTISNSASWSSTKQSNIIIKTCLIPSMIQLKHCHLALASKSKALHFENSIKKLSYLSRRCTEYHDKWTRICSICRNHNLVLFSFMTYHQVNNKSITTGATCGAGTAYPSSSPPVFILVRVTPSLVFCLMFCRSLFVLFLLVIYIYLYILFRIYPFTTGAPITRVVVMVRLSLSIYIIRS